MLEAAASSLTITVSSGRRMAKGARKSMAAVVDTPVHLLDHSHLPQLDGGEENAQEEEDKETETDEEEEYPCVCGCDCDDDACNCDCSLVQSPLAIYLHRLWCPITTN